MVADSPPAFSSNRASFAQRQVTQEQLRATQEELSSKIRELQIYESNYIQLKKDLSRWKKKFEFIFRENELLSLETTKLDASHKQIAFLQQEIKFKEEESEALRGLVSALEASNKKARASRLDSAARLAHRRDLPAAAAAGAAVLDQSTAGVIASNGVDLTPISEQLERERHDRMIEKERFDSELQALKAENSMLLKDLDRRDMAQQLSDDKVLAHKDRIASLEQSLKDEQDSHMTQLREKQDLISELETQMQQMERRRRSSAVSRDEAEAFGPTTRLLKTKSIDEDGDEEDPEEPDTPPGTPPPISAGGLLPAATDPKADQIVKDWEDDKRIRPARSTEFEWPRIDAFVHKLPYEATDGAERILRQVLDPDQFPDISESQLLVRAIPPELKKELQEFVVPLLKAHSHLRVTYSTMQRRTLVTDVRLMFEQRESEFTGGLALGEKRFGRDHMFYGPSHDDVTRLVLHTARYLTHEKKAIYVSKSQEQQTLQQSMATTVGSELDLPPTTPNETNGGTMLEANGTTSAPGAGPGGAGEAKAGGKKWPIGLSDKTKKLMGNMAAAAKQRVARLNQNKHVHEGTTCQFCQTTPIVGGRYSCSTCVGFDLCENCYALGGHGLENSDELFYRVQELVLAKCPRLVDELDLLELLRFEICRSNLRKFSFCLNWLADIVNGKTSQQLQARALEIPGIRRDIRKLFVPLLIRVCSDREDLEVKTEWELESDNAAEVKSVDTSASGRASLGEGDGRFLETLRIWVADQYRTTSPFVERSLLKFREGMAVEGDSEEEASDGEMRDHFIDHEDAETPSRRRAMTAAARLTETNEERVASTRRGVVDRSRMVSQEF